MLFTSKTQKPKQSKELEEAKAGLKARKSKLKKVREALQSVVLDNEEPPETEQDGLRRFAMAIARDRR